MEEAAKRRVITLSRDEYKEIRSKLSRFADANMVGRFNFEQKADGKPKLSHVSSECVFNKKLLYQKRKHCIAGHRKTSTKEAA